MRAQLYHPTKRRPSSTRVVVFFTQGGALASTKTYESDAAARTELHEIRYVRVGPKQQAPGAFEAWERDDASPPRYAGICFDCAAQPSRRRGCKCREKHAEREAAAEKAAKRKAATARSSSGSG